MPGRGALYLWGAVGSGISAACLHHQAASWQSVAHAVLKGLCVRQTIACTCTSCNAERDVSAAALLDTLWGALTVGSAIERSACIRGTHAELHLNV